MEKFASARHTRQHAERVRSPEQPVERRSRNELIYLNGEGKTIQANFARAKQGETPRLAGGGAARDFSKSGAAQELLDPF